MSNTNMSKMIRSLPLRITPIKPPPGVPLCLQQGKDDLVRPTSDSGENLYFDFTVKITNNRTDGPPNFRGPFVQALQAADSYISMQEPMRDIWIPVGRGAPRYRFRVSLGS
jgi:hypothetical protein